MQNFVSCFANICCTYAILKFLFLEYLYILCVWYFCSIKAFVHRESNESVLSFVASGIPVTERQTFFNTVELEAPSSCYVYARTRTQNPSGSPDALVSDVSQWWLKPVSEVAGTPQNLCLCWQDPTSTEHVTSNCTPYRHSGDQRKIV